MFIYLFLSVNNEAEKIKDSETGSEKIPMQIKFSFE